VALRAECQSAPRVAMSTVSVLVQGRRENVKVTPGMHLHSVVEEVCRRRQLDPAAHTLKQERGGSPPLELSLTFRLSGLTNNARLELVPRIMSVPSGSCRVGIQLPDGTRLINSFPVSASLEEVAQWCAAQPQLGGGMTVRSLMHTGNAVEGASALHATILYRIGGTPGGSLLLRAELGTSEAARVPEGVDTQSVPVLCAVEAPVPVAEGPAPVAQTPIPSPMNVDVEPVAPASGPTEAVVDQVGAPEGGRSHWEPTPVPAEFRAAAASAAAAAAQPTAEASGDALGLLFTARQRLRPSLQELRRSTGGGATFHAACATVHRFLVNISSAPQEAKFRTIRLTNAAVHSRLAQFGGGVETLETCGFVRDGEIMHLPLPAGANEAGLAQQVDTLKALSEALASAGDAARAAAARNLAAVDERAQLAVEPLPAAPTPAPRPSAHAARRQQQTQQQLTLTEARVEALRARKEAVDDTKTVERCTTVFRTTGRSLQAAIRAAESLPENFFELSTQDVVLPGGGGAAAGPSAAPNCPAGGGSGGGEPAVQTKAMRELARLERIREYSRTTVRVRVSADLLLQTRFHPQEPARRLAEVLEGECLVPQAGATLRLYTTPPMTHVDQARSFAAQQLAPAALVHASWDMPTGAGSERLPLELRPNLLDRIVELPVEEAPPQAACDPTPQQGTMHDAAASAAAAERRAAGCLMGGGSSSASPSGMPGGAVRSAGEASEAKRPPGGKPKWFKM